MDTHLFLPRIVLSLFLSILTFCLSIPIYAQASCVVANSLEGMLIEGSGVAVMDLGTVGTVSVQGGVSLAIQDLLESERVGITTRIGLSFDSSSVLSFAFGDLLGIPAIGLLLEPHGFPNQGSIQSLQKNLQVPPISLDPGDDSLFAVGLATRIPLGLDALIFPFCFTPLAQRGNPRGGGVEAILPTPNGFLTLGACLAGRSLNADAGDELFYGAYPSQRGLFVQFSIIMLPHRFILPMVGIGGWNSSLQIFTMQDTFLGQGVSYSSHVGIDIASWSLAWDFQLLPIVMGTPATAVPKADTSILQEMQLELASVTGPIAVVWKVTEKIWRPSPYASDYQKRTISTQTTLDFTKAEVTAGCELREETHWMVDGMLKHTGSLALHFGLQVDDVRLELNPVCAFATGSALEMKLDCTLERQFRNGILWEGAIYFKQENVRIVLSAAYEEADIRVKVTCDSLRKVSISLTIGR